MSDFHPLRTPALRFKFEFMSSQTRVITGMNGAVPVLWLVFFAILSACVLLADFSGRGLNQTQAFLVLGPLVYPIFYGMCAFVIFRFTLLFRQRQDFLAVANETLKFGARSIPAGDVREVLITRPLGIKMLVVVPREGSDLRIAGFSLARPVTEVAVELRELLNLR